MFLILEQDYNFGRNVINIKDQLNYFIYNKYNLENKIDNCI